MADEALVDSIIDYDEKWRKSNYQMETLGMEFGKINMKIVGSTEQLFTTLANHCFPDSLYSIISQISRKCMLGNIAYFPS